MVRVGQVPDSLFGKTETDFCSYSSSTRTPPRDRLGLDLLSWALDRQSPGRVGLRDWATLETAGLAW